MADRYCRSCGHELRPEERFCTGCGRGVYETAHVPTPEADVPLPPPPQQAETVSKLPPQAPEQAASSPPRQQQPTLGRWKQFRRPILWFLGSVLFAGVMSAASDPANYGEPGMNTAESAGFFVGGIIIEVATVLWNYVTLLLVFGVVLYLYRRVRGTESTFLQSVFDRRLITVMVILILLVGILSLFM